MSVLVLAFDNTTGMMLAQLVDSAQLANGAVTSAKMGAGEVGTPHIASGLDAARIASGSILPAIVMGGDISLGANKLKTTTCLVKEIASEQLSARTVADDDYVVFNALDFRFSRDVRAISTTTYLSARSVTGAILILRAQDTGIGYAEVARLQGAATARLQLIRGQVTSSLVVDAGVPVDDVDISAHTHTGGASDAPQIASGGVASGQVGIPHIYPGAVVSAKIGANAIGTPHLAANAIVSGKIVQSDISLALLGERAHGSLTGVTANLHHAEFTSGMHNFPHPSALIAALAITSGKVASGGLSPLTSGKIWAGFTGNMPREENKPAAGPTIATGTYSGDDTDDRQITVGFKCSFVYVYCITDGYGNKIAWITILSNPDATVRLLFTPGTFTSVRIHATDGFRVWKSRANYTGGTYYYWAISE